MTIRNLDFAFHPGSVAVFGASDAAGPVGAVVMANMLGGGFEGPVWPVNPHHSEVAGRRCFGSAADLPETLISP